MIKYKDKNGSGDNKCKAPPTLDAQIRDRKMVIKHTHKNIDTHIQPLHQPSFTTASPLPSCPGPRMPPILGSRRWCGVGHVSAWRTRQTGQVPRPSRPPRADKKYIAEERQKKNSSQECLPFAISIQLLFFCLFISILKKIWSCSFTTAFMGKKTKCLVDQNILFFHLHM